MPRSADDASMATGAIDDTPVGAVVRALPSPRAGRHDLVAATPPARSLVPGGLTVKAERELAVLAGIDLPPAVAGEPDDDEPVVVPAGSGADFGRRLLHVAELVTFGGFVLLVLSAILEARFGDGSLHVHEIPFAAWGLGAAVSALTLAAFSGSPDATGSPVRRRVIGSLLTVALLTCVTGVVSNAAGVAGPAWVLFLPLVLVTGAVTGPVLGLLVGAGAAAGVYTAAAVSHTLTVAGAGRLVVLLPAFPAVGWAAGALARLSQDAAREAQVRRQMLEGDVRALSTLLEQVADGDLSTVPAAGTGADPVTTSLAVAFADTLLALRRLVRQMSTVSDQLSGSATELAGSAEQGAEGISAQVAAVAQTTTTIEQLAATAAAIADTAVRVSQFAGSTRRDVDLGVDAVERSTAAMQQIAARVAALDARSRMLHERIERVGSTTRVIEQISRRTSILAVNASIEAARAGEHGQGFSTVAAEVATLATRAREATKRIESIVGELQQEAAATAAASREGHAAVEAGVALQDEVVASLGRISRMVDRTTAASRDITGATRRQRVAADAVVAAMTTVTEAGERYREGGQSHAQAAGRLRDLARDCRTTLGRFRLT